MPPRPVQLLPVHKKGEWRCVKGVTSSVSGAGVAPLGVLGTGGMRRVDGTGAMTLDQVGCSSLMEIGTPTPEFCALIYQLETRNQKSCRARNLSR